jgi:hypothetical protein
MRPRNGLEWLREAQNATERQQNGLREAHRGLEGLQSGN